MSVGYTPAAQTLYQAQAKFRYDDATSMFRIEQLPPHAFAAGSAGVATDGSADAPCPPSGAGEQAPTRKAMAEAMRRGRACMAFLLCGFGACAPEAVATERRRRLRCRA